MRDALPWPDESLPQPQAQRRCSGGEPATATSDERWRLGNLSPREHFAIETACAVSTSLGHGNLYLIDAANSHDVFELRQIWHGARIFHELLQRSHDFRPVEKFAEKINLLLQVLARNWFHELLGRRARHRIIF